MQLSRSCRVVWLLGVLVAPGCGSVAIDPIDAAVHDTAAEIDAPIDAPQQPDATPDSMMVTMGCGNSTVDTGEDCDGAPTNESCVTRGFASGTLGCTSGCAFDTSACTSSSANLVVWYRFEENAGATAASDSSGNNVTASVVGTTTFGGAGRVGKAIALDGSAGYLNAGTPSVVTNLAAVTAEGWVKLDAHTMHGANLVGKMGGNGNLDFGVQIDDNPAGAAIWLSSATDSTYGYRSIQTAGDQAVLGTWVHLAGVYVVNTNFRQLYVNGVAVAAPTAFGTDVAAPMNESGPLRIGNILWDGGNGFGAVDGMVDEVKIWNVQRTQPQICSDAGGIPIANGGCDLTPL